jgi:lipoate-protein ligase A
MSEEETLRDRVTEAVREVFDASSDLGITVTVEQVASAVLAAIEAGA